MANAIDQTKMRAFERDLIRQLRDSGVMTAREADDWLENRRRDDDQQSVAFYRRLAALVANPRPRPGRPKHEIRRDTLIYCLRDCAQMEYYRIDEFLKAHSLKVPVSENARYAARRAGLKSLSGRSCTHAELRKILSE